MNPSNRVKSGLFVLACVVMFGVACGGGGDGNGPTAPLGTTTVEVEFESFQLANNARANNSVRPQLDLADRVAEVARAHSESMRDNGFFGHAGPDGGVRAAGENLAKLSNVPNPASEAHRQFMDSAQHREVMLDSRFQLAGVGVARSGDTYWLTQIYIKR